MRRKDRITGNEIKLDRGELGSRNNEIEKMKRLEMPKKQAWRIRMRERVAKTFGIFRRKETKLMHRKNMSRILVDKEFCQTSKYLNNNIRKWLIRERAIFPNQNCEETKKIRVAKSSWDDRKFKTRPEWERKREKKEKGTEQMEMKWNNFRQVWHRKSIKRQRNSVGEWEKEKERVCV